MTTTTTTNTNQHHWIGIVVLVGWIVFWMQYCRWQRTKRKWYTLVQTVKDFVQESKQTNLYPNPSSDTDTDDDVFVVASSKIASIPISGEYEITHTSSHSIRQILSIQFTSVGDDSFLYYMRGDGRRNSTNSTTPQRVTISGVYNAKTRLLWWNEMMDTTTAATSCYCWQPDNEATILSHGSIDFHTQTIHGWFCYYNSIQKGGTFDTIQQLSSYDKDSPNEEHNGLLFDFTIV